MLAHAGALMSSLIFMHNIAVVQVNSNSLHAILEIQFVKLKHLPI